MMKILSKKTPLPRYLNFDIEDIVLENEKQILIELPTIENGILRYSKKYKHNGYRFYFPTSMVIKSRSGTLKLKYFPDFKIKLFKNEQTSQNQWSIVDTQEVSGDELRIIMKNCVEDYKKIKEKEEKIKKKVYWEVRDVSSNPFSGATNNNKE